MNIFFILYAVKEFLYSCSKVTTTMIFADTGKETTTACPSLSGSGYDSFEHDKTSDDIG
jgi:hypothetical protein